MTTVDLRSWTPTAPAVPQSGAVDGAEIYTGKHRKLGIRTISLARMIYRPRHRAH